MSHQINTAELLQSNEIKNTLASSSKEKKKLIAITDLVCMDVRFVVQEGKYTTQFSSLPEAVKAYNLI